MSKLLNVKNLTKKYKDFKLNDVSFSLKKGYIMGFIGPNGAGKSTTINLIMNLIKKNSGTIEIMGLDNIKDEIKIKDKIGFVYDENFYYDDLKISEIKYIISGFYKNWDEDKYKKYLKLFNLSPKSKIKKLSKGMKMKVSILMALSHNSELIIMDEPTSGLDPVFRSELLDILSEIIQNEEKSVLFSTHITSDLERIADYITFINNGEVVFSKSKEEIDEKYKIVKGDNSIIESYKKFENEIIGIKKNSFGFEGLTDNIDKLKKTFSNKIVYEKSTLDDIMVYMTRGNR